MIDSGQMFVKDTRGTALAELALVLPLLLVLIMGMLDFGKAFNEWIDETHLANEGARLAAVGYVAAGCTSALNPNTCIAKQIQSDTNIPDVKNVMFALRRNRGAIQGLRLRALVHPAAT